MSCEVVHFESRNNMSELSDVSEQEFERLASTIFYDSSDGDVRIDNSSVLSNCKFNSIIIVNIVFMTYLNSIIINILNYSTNSGFVRR